MQKKLKINKQNLTLDQIKYLTGLNLWNYGGICKAMMIRQQKTKRGKNVYRQIPNQFLWHKV